MDPSSAIDRLFASLHNSGPGPKKVTYGRELCVTESQTRTLVALAYLLPTRLTAALELIEEGHCQILTFQNHRIYMIENQPVCLRLWSCPCSDFNTQLKRSGVEPNRWRRVCRHILAAYVVDERFPILDYVVVSEETVSLDVMIEMSLNS